MNEDVERRRTELCVIDTPGTCDSGALLEDNLAHISAHLRGEDAGATASDEADITIKKKGAPPNANERTSNAEHLAPRGPGLKPARVHAFVLVLSAAARFTQEEAIALERLVSRLGKDALRHSCVAVTRAEEVIRDQDGGSVGDADDARTVAALSLARSAPPGLRRLMERMPYHARGAPPVLVENFPSDAFLRTLKTKRTPERRRRVASARRGRRSSPRRLTSATPSLPSAESTRGRRRDLAACAYEPEQLARERGGGV